VNEFSKSIMGFIIRGGIVVSEKVYREGAVVVEGERIVDVGGAEEILRRYPRYEQIDARGTVIIPGLVNAHTHVAMNLLRGYAEDLPLLDWLQKRIWPVEAKLTPEDIEIGATLGIYEALLSGTTTINTQYFYSEEGSEAHAILKTGIRGVVGHGFFERTKEVGLRTTEEMVKKWHGREGRIRVSVNPHAPYSTGPSAYKEAHELALRLNEEYGSEGRIVVHTHLAESLGEADLVKKIFGASFEGGAVSYLDSLGVLDELTVAAHVIHTSDEEIGVLARKGVSCVLNPISNLKIGMGIAPYPKLRRSGVVVGLGTDGAASNNTLDMFESMKILPLLHKGITGDTTLVPAKEAFEVATVGGARALKWSDEIGLIKRGYRADIVVLQARKMNAKPLYNVYNHLVYSVRAGDVLHVFVDGRQLVENGKIVGLDEERFFEKVDKVKDDLLKRVGVEEEWVGG